MKKLAKERDEVKMADNNMRGGRVTEKKCKGGKGDNEKKSKERRKVIK